jgi:hypothetical protein
MNQCTNRLYCMWSLSLSPIGRRWTSLSRTECLSCCQRLSPRPRVLSALPLNQPRANRRFEGSVRLCLRVFADCFDSRLTRRSPYLLLTATRSRSRYSSQLTAPLVYDVVLKTAPCFSLLWLSQYSAKTQARPFPGQKSLYTLPHVLSLHSSPIISRKALPHHSLPS